MAAYLAENPSAVKTPSGLVFHETASGTREAPDADSTVIIHYKGTLVDGTEFDSSVDRGKAQTMPLDKLPQGLREGLTMMKAGGQATLVLPPELGFGDEGLPRRWVPTGLAWYPRMAAIGPGATLTFEVYLFSIA